MADSPTPAPFALGEIVSVAYVPDPPQATSAATPPILRVTAPVRIILGPIADSGSTWILDFGPLPGRPRGVGILVDADGAPRPGDDGFGASGYLAPDGRPWVTRVEAAELVRQSAKD